MLVYQATKSEFLTHVARNEIADRILLGFQRHGQPGVSQNEVRSWQNSLQYMRNVLDDADIPNDAGVALEFKVPQTSKRIDFILTGFGSAPGRRPAAVIVELKQWEHAETTAKDGVVRTFLGGTEREVPHPSYQAWTYAALLKDYNEAVETTGADLRPCAYLHNCTSTELVGEHYKDHLAKAPLFLKSDQAALQRFLRQHVKYGDRGDLMYRIENGRIRPSRALADHLVGLIDGNREFTLIDDQKLVYETALSAAERAQDGRKQVYIVEGGPGTGKSVVAVNLLVELTRREYVVQYVSRNAAPREVYRSKLAGTMTRTRIDNLFRGSGSYVGTAPDTFNALIVDEAHRLNEHSGLYGNLGENQISEAIRAAKATVFFIDEAQRVTLKDIGTVATIRELAEAEGAEVAIGRLESQFRCNGSDGYLAWLDDVLQVRATANDSISNLNYEFEVVDSPSVLRDKIIDANIANNKSRMVAGYCWDWRSKRDPHAFDLEFPAHEFAAQWNLTDDGSLWILKPNSVEQVGCIHTCQGLELDYVGVIIGPDLVVRDGRVVTNGFARSRMDTTIKGFKGMFRQDARRASVLADEVIKNTYRTLMTRGTKGCFVWSEDTETREYFRLRALRGID